MNQKKLLKKTAFLLKTQFSRHYQLYLFSFILLFLQLCTFKIFSENVAFSAAQEISNGNEAQIATNKSGRYVYAATSSFSDIKVFYSSDFGATWTDADPSSIIFGGGTDPEIRTDSTGQYVCIVFKAGATPTGPIKTFISSDFGVTWTETTSGSFGDGRSPIKEISNSGKFVYVTWENTTDDIKTFASSDFGATWTDTTSGSFGKGNFPQMTTNSSGQYVYLIFPNNTSNAITTFVSSDFGQTWTNTTSGSFGNGKNFPVIVTDNSGQYVYTIWSDNISDEIKIFISSDFGATWSQATTAFGDGFDPQISTDSSGKFIYAIWRQDSTDDLIIYKSEDFGANWEKISDEFGDGFKPQIITDISGRYVYAIWQIANISSSIKIFYSTDFGNSWINADPSTTLFGTGNNTQITTNDTGRYVYGAWVSSLTVTTGIRSFFPISSIDIVR